eukprot:5995201-Amphidinium_carterae.2
MVTGRGGQDAIAPPPHALSSTAFAAPAACGLPSLGICARPHCDCSAVGCEAAKLACPAGSHVVLHWLCPPPLCNLWR